LGCHPDVGGDEVVLKFVEQVGLFAQQQLVAGAGVEGEQRKGGFVGASIKPATSTTLNTH